MTAPEGTGTLFAGQWRLAEVQLANWGTFDGAIYRVPIARRGHLITGPSGSGKSSLLDAIAAVLTPDKWLRLNQAAQGAGRRADQRTMLTYVRGAWSRTIDETEDRVVSSYLRRTATWSGIVLHFDDGQGNLLSLARLFFVRASGTTASDLSDICLIERSEVDLADLQEHAASGLEARKLQQRWPDALITSNHAHGRFYARLRSIFGMGDETALQLLHKTQAAKNLDSLDQLFRDYMLERPTTFDLAETAVTQFAELRAAHERIVQLREQRDHLLQLRAQAEIYEAADAAARQAHALIEAEEPYRRRRTLRLAAEESTQLRAELIGLETDEQEARDRAARADESVRAAELRANELGGGQAEVLQDRRRAAEQRESAVHDRWQQLDADLRRVGVRGAPTSREDHAELMASIEQLLAQASTASGPSHDQLAELAAARGDLRAADEAIAAARSSRSGVPGDLLSIRRQLAEQLSVPESSLPFAAELVDVRPEHEDWRGAIERVLRPFALTLLVRSPHLPAARRWIDATRLGTRVVFEEVAADGASPRPAGSPLSLVNRVTVREGAFRTWVLSRLSERYDYACVERPDDMDDHARAVTINGQVRASQTRYEKDDRWAIDDRRRWVLGDPAHLLDALLEHRAAAQERVDGIQGIIERLEAGRDAESERRGVLGVVRNQSWAEVDRDGATAAVRAIDEQLAELTSRDAGLDAALAAVRRAEQERVAARQRALDVGVRLKSARAAADEVAHVVTETRAAIDAGRIAEVDDATAAELDERFRIRRNITRQQLPEVGLAVLRTLQGERDQAQDAARQASEGLIRSAVSFNGRWPQASTELTATVADRSGYLTLLDSIVARGLPEHEADFLRLLRERSRDLIGELVSDILGAPHEIDERVTPINASLRRSPFDVGVYLRLRVKTRRSETVNRFLQDLRSISEGSWTDDELTTAEERFATLAEIMRRLESSDHVDRTWRQACLDTRQHVTFLAEEIDEGGRVLATYDSGAAMSGGQQQKLVIFCLAAALRYQLADPDDPFPRYGTIVLDEAFDKADTRYTRMALDIFVEFGFQMVLATPQKLLQTIEPYVDGATSIENPSRRRSDVAQVQWDREASGAP
ncbi:ATP-binding protein [Janibacter terrae]|uniref:ATP-binding protein n=1 Tax=Janibacter terrae TaxID=103817 RepID=UPI003812E26C